MSNMAKLGFVGILILMSCKIKTTYLDKYYFSQKQYEEQGIIGYCPNKNGTAYPVTDWIDGSVPTRYQLGDYDDLILVGKTQLISKYDTTYEIIWPTRKFLKRINRK